jgi:hypothetical protein
MWKEAKRSYPANRVGVGVSDFDSDHEVINYPVTWNWLFVLLN